MKDRDGVRRGASHVSRVPVAEETQSDVLRPLPHVAVEEVQMLRMQRGEPRERAPELATRVADLRGEPWG